MSVNVNDIAMKSMMILADGNPGAVTCIMGLGSFDYNKSKEILDVVIDNEIFGTDLYVLWSDISDKNYNLMHYIIKNAPADKIKYASQQQDYSGRNVLKQWIDGYKIASV